MKTISLRSFSREAPTIDEVVLLTHESQVIGRFIPVGLDRPDAPGPSRPPILGGSFGTSRPAPKPGKTK